MRYDYICHDCSTPKRNFVFEASHGMNEKPIIPCPKCQSTKTEKAFLTCNTFYIRGNGYLDKSGVQRDMNLHTLMRDDPYAKMRERGEKDDLAHRLRKAGKHNPKRKHFQVKKTKLA